MTTSAEPRKGTQDSPSKTSGLRPELSPLKSSTRSFSSTAKSDIEPPVPTVEQAKPESKRTEVPEPGTSEDRTPGKDSEDSGERYSLKEPGGDNPFQAPVSSLAKLNVLESRVKRSRRPVDQYRTAHELTQDAAADFDPEFWRKKGEYPALLLNKTAAEFLREVMGGPGFNGVFLSAEEALDLAETAGKQIHLLEYVNFPKARDAIREIQEALREASAWGNVTAVVVENRSDAAVRRTLLHERFHLFQSTQKGGLGRGAIGAGFLQDSLARSAAEIIAERTRGSVEDVWHEVPAYIAAGQGQTLALTQAEGLRLFGRYLELLRQHYGQKAV